MPGQSMKRPIRRSCSSSASVGPDSLHSSLRRQVSDTDVELPTTPVTRDPQRKVLQAPLLESSSQSRNVPLFRSAVEVDPLAQLSLAQSEISCLCIDRNYRRSRSPNREAHLSDDTSAKLKAQERIIAALSSTNKDLEARLADAVSTGKQLLTRLKEALRKHDALYAELNDANRRISRLKKSDRVKGKVQQRNFQLKAFLHGHVCRQGGGRGDTLLEALALAVERIEDLESKGKVLLGALDDLESGTGGAKDEQEDGSKIGRVEAEVVFRGVLEDQSFREQKASWEDFLESW